MRWLAPVLFGRRVPLPLIAWLALVWVTLWGEVSAGNVLGGLAAGLVTTWLLPLPVLDQGIRIRPVALAVLLLWFGADMVLSTARVVAGVLRPGCPPTQFVTVRLRTTSEPMTMMIMVALSSMPGSLVVHVREEGGELVLHVLGRPGDVTGTVREEVAKLEARVVAAFGTGNDREELR
jgi:multicomponent Na+:H+ antiporter subunit E